MSEHLTYHTIDELRALSIEELRALWELVPTDRQHRYQTVYQREINTNGASGSDALEIQVVTALIQRYVNRNIDVLARLGATAATGHLNGDQGRKNSNDWTHGLPLPTNTPDCI